MRFAACLTLTLVGFFLAPSPPALQADVEKTKDAQKPEGILTLDIDPTGRWEGYKKGLTVRYLLWKDEKGWHVLVASGMYKRRYQGTITLDRGQVKDFKGLAKLERKGETKDYCLTNEKKTQILFDFTTHEGEDELSFSVGPETKRIFFNLRIDGKDQPGLIFIGKKGTHPPKTQFYLPVSGEKKKD